MLSENSYKSYLVYGSIVNHYYIFKNELNSKEIVGNLPLLSKQ